MAKVGGKLWGGILGMMFGGPLGAIAGVFVGHQIDGVSEKMSESAVFQINLIAILAHVAKIDGHVDDREIKTILAFYHSLGFRGERMAVIEKTLRFALTQDIDLKSTCENFKKATNYEGRRLFLRVVYMVIMADQKVHANERAVLEEIVRYLEITQEDFDMLTAEFIQTNDKHYEILGLKRGVTRAEVKKAYRKLALTHHPDRVQHLGEEFVKISEEKFKAINEAHTKVLDELQAVGAN